MSLWLRLVRPGSRIAPWPSRTQLIAYGLMLAGAYVGGELVFTLGNMVNRHAWRFGGRADWVKLDVTDIPEGKPTAAKAGTQSLVVVRDGETVYALHAQCAHAGGPLPSGKIVDGCIECPWHYSRYDLATAGERRDRRRSTSRATRFARLTVAAGKSSACSTRPART